MIEGLSKLTFEYERIARVEVQELNQRMRGRLMADLFGLNGLAGVVRKKKAGKRLRLSAAMKKRRRAENLVAPSPPACFEAATPPCPPQYYLRCVGRKVIHSWM